MIVNDTFTALLAGMVLGAAWCYVFLAWYTGQTEQEPDPLTWDGTDAISIELDEPYDYEAAAAAEREANPMVTVRTIPGPTVAGRFSLTFGGQLAQPIADDDPEATEALRRELAHLQPDADMRVTGGPGEPFVVTFGVRDPLSYHRGTYAWGYHWSQHLPPDALDPVVRYYPFSDRELHGVRDRLAERGLALKVVTPGETVWDRPTYTITTRIQWLPDPDADKRRTGEPFIRSEYEGRWSMPRRGSDPLNRVPDA